MTDKKLTQKACVSHGKSWLCDGCIFRHFMLEYDGCKRCRDHYIDAYKKGYKQAQRDMRNNSNNKNKK